MAIPRQIFRAYDIRGNDVDEVTPEVARQVGRAYVILTEAKSVAIGRDMRSSSFSLSMALAEGVMDMGADVIDIGLCTTPMLYYAVGLNANIEGGLMVTASHQPAGHNGIKMVRGDVSPIGFGCGMEELLALVISGVTQTTTKGTRRTQDTLGQYLNTVFEYAGMEGGLRVPVVMDAGNGMVGSVLSEVVRRTGVQVAELYWELDGRFPNHEANPIKPETLEDLQRAVREKGAALGFAYDADGDRIGLVDERGEIVPGDMIGALLVPLMLAKHPGGVILGDVRCSRDLEHVVQEHGGQFVRTMVGHAHIKRLMSEHGGVFGVELSAHLYYADFFKVESAILTTLLVLKLVAHADRPLSELVEQIQRHVASGEINFEVQDKEIVMREVKALLSARPGAIIDEQDGARVDGPSWWVSVRPSANDPVLRLNVEAESRKEMEVRRDEIIELIKLSPAGGRRV